MRPPLWFQGVTEGKSGKNRVHVDLYPTGRDNSMSMEQRVEVVEARVAELTALGATVLDRSRSDDPDDLAYFVVRQDPEGNESCIS